MANIHIAELSHTLDTHWPKGLIFKGFSAQKGPNKNRVLEASDFILEVLWMSKDAGLSANCLALETHEVAELGVSSQVLSNGFQQCHRS